MSVEVYQDNGGFVLVDAQMPNRNGILIRYTILVPDFWLIVVDQQTYCAYKNSRDVNTAVKNREVPNPDWPTYVAEVRKKFVTFNSARQQLALAVEQTDLSTEEEAEQGKGKRPKRPPARYCQSSLEDTNYDSSDDQMDSSDMLASCPSFPNLTRGFYTSTQYSQDVDYATSSHPPQNNSAEPPPVSVGGTRFVRCEQESMDLEFGSQCAGAEENAQIYSQSISSPIIDSEANDSPPPVRRHLPAVAKRLSFPCVGKRPSTSGVDRRSSTSGVASQPASSGVASHPAPSGVASQPASLGIASQPASSGVASQPASSGVASQPASSGVASRPHTLGVAIRPSTASAAIIPSSADARRFSTPVINSRPLTPSVVSRPPTPAGIIGNSFRNRDAEVMLATEQRHTRRERPDGIDKTDTFKIYKAILKLTVEVNDLKDLIKVLTKICVSQADSHTEGSESLEDIPISSLADFKKFELQLKDSEEKYSSLVKFIKCVGGNSEADAIQRAWEKLTTIDCRAYFVILMVLSVVKIINIP